MANVNDFYFDGHYREIWRSYIPEELTARETDFLLQFFHLKPGSKVLDIMCGYGRHAFALASHGIETTAVDNLAAYIDEIRQKASKDQLPVKAILSTVSDYQPSDTFDVAICMGNSLNFFPAHDTIAIFHKLASCVKPKGHLLINTWTLAEIAIKHFSKQSWEKAGDLKILHEARYAFFPSRIETDTIIIDPAGKEEWKKAIDYIYSINEMESMMNAAGFRLQEVFSIPGKKKFSVGDVRAYLVAEKIS